MGENERFDFLDQIFLGPDDYIDEAFKNLLPLLQKQQEYTPPPGITRVEKQWILLISATFVDQYSQYVLAHTRPAFRGLCLFLCDATEKMLLGAPKDPRVPCRSSQDLAYPTYYHVFVKAMCLWLCRWDPYGAWSALYPSLPLPPTTCLSDSSGAVANQAVSEPVPAPHGSMAM